jgi:transposase
MFIKTVKKRNKGYSKVYTYHRLMESYRTPQGPRQITLLELGKLELPQSQWKHLADRIEQIVMGQQRIIPVQPDIEKLAQHYASLLINKRIEVPQKTIAAEDEPVEEYRTVDVNSVDTQQVRTIGAEYVGLSYFQRLKFDKLFRELGFSEKQIKLTALLIIGRLVRPASERKTLWWAKRVSGMDELLGTKFTNLHHNALYRTSDLLLAQKSEIEKRLREEERDLFCLEEKIILYDLTNTYFEGKSYGEEITYGKSKDKRYDCPLLTLGLVLDGDGFPKVSEIFPGNVSEPETLEEVLGILGAKGGSTVLIDAGVATEENLLWLKGEGYHYVGVARGKPFIMGDEQNEEGLITIREGKDNRVEAKLYSGETEKVLYCQSRLKKLKEQSMKDAFQRRFELGLEAVRESLSKKRGTKRYEKVVERIGRLKERSHGIHQYYEIELEKGEDGKVKGIRYEFKKQKEAEERYSGSYYLRTSRTDLSEKEIWDLYITLSGVEDSFRALKSELGMRPVYHYKKERIEGHIFITLLAYHILNSIRYTLRKKGYFMRWSTVREGLSTHVVNTVSMKTKEGKTLFIRDASKAEVFHREIYQALRLKPIPLKRKRMEL